MILGVESSCDESAIAIFDPSEGVAGNWVHSQIKLHSHYGGIVPELASREHLSNFAPLLQFALKNIRRESLTAIAVTRGPGLAACLALGVSFSKSLAQSWGLPLYGVNHLRAHAYSTFIAMHRKEPKNFAIRLSECLPHLGLIVSGGNTVLFEINQKRIVKIIAQTVDDAAGEALDKGAKLLGMQYPGGPLIEKFSEGGDLRRFDFPRAFPSREEMKFSFSGLKTSLRYKLESMSEDEIRVALPDLCASYQQAVIDQLIKKCGHAFDIGNYASIGLSGGVSNNRRLRDAVKSFATTKGIVPLIADSEYTGDNAAMIAFTAWADKENTLLSTNCDLKLDPSMTLNGI